MEKTQFTPETLMEYLLKKFEHLNDNGQKAKEMYDMIMSMNSK